MSDVYLMHNPYLIHTELEIDNEKINSGPLWEHISGQRLQMWVDSFFDKLVDHCNSSQLTVRFKGTSSDSADIEEAIQAAEEKYNIKVHFEREPGAEPDDKVDAMRALFDDATKGPIEEFHDTELAATFERLMDPTFDVYVLATMSAGKSTLINAMLGHDLLPSKNEACTATVVRIEDRDGETTFQGRPMDAEGKPIQDWSVLDNGKLQDWNKPEIACVEVKGDVPAITNKHARLVLVDTPGPNNSQNVEHGKVTLRAVRDRHKPMVLYVLNSGQLGTHDDHRLLTAVSEEMHKAGKQSRDRFIFAVNKVDQFDPDKEGVELALDNIKTYLTNHNAEGARVFPVSARTAKVIRLNKKGVGLSGQEKRVLRDHDLFTDDERLQLLQYCDVTRGVRSEISEAIEEARRNGDTETEALYHSGIPTIEAAIEEYLRKYALPAKIKDAFESFKHIIDKHDVLSKIQSEMAENDDKRKMVQNSIKEIRERMQRGDKAKRLRMAVGKSKWKPSRTYKQIKQKLLTEVEKKTHTIIEQLSKENNARGRMEIARCELAFKDLEKQLCETQAELEERLSTICQGEVERRKKDLEAKYRSFMEEFLGENRLSNTEIDIDLSNLLAEIPSCDHFIAENLKEKTFVDKVFRFYFDVYFRPWRLFDKNRGKEVEISALKDQIRGLHGHFNRAIDDVEDALEKKMDIITSEFLDKSEELDGKLELLLEDLENLSESEEACRKRIEENWERLEFLHDFRSRLDSILAI